MVPGPFSNIDVLAPLADTWLCSNAPAAEPHLKYKPPKEVELTLNEVLMSYLT